MQDRYPGQRQEDDSGPIEHRWRFYIPQLGMYSSPDPMHRVAAEGHYGPHAYTYAASAPLRYSDATGQYFVDESFNQNFGHKMMAQNALVKISSDKRCRCAFKVIHGREPFSDPFSIRYRDGTIRSDPATGETWEVDGTAPTGVPWISIGLPSFASIERVRNTMAHEMVHRSFQILGHYENRAKNPEWMGSMCEGNDPGETAWFDASQWKAIRACQECCD